MPTLTYLTRDSKLSKSQKLHISFAHKTPGLTKSDRVRNYLITTLYVTIVSFSLPVLSKNAFKSSSRTFSLTPILPSPLPSNIITWFKINFPFSHNSFFLSISQILLKNMVFKICIRRAFILTKHWKNTGHIGAVTSLSIAIKMRRKRFTMIYTILYETKTILS